VLSARYAGEPKSDIAQQRETDRRPARDRRSQRTFRICVIVLGALGRRPAARSSPRANGTARSSKHARGDGGFGYDPHFFVPISPNRRRPNSTPNSRTPCRTARRPCATCCRACRGFRGCSPDEPVIPLVPARSVPAPGGDASPLQFTTYRRRCRSTSTFRGACANAPTATSTRTRCATASRKSAYIDALIADLEHSLPDIWGRRIHSIFFGGGTPSLMTPAALDRPADCGARPRATDAGRRNHARGQPRHGRSGSLHRLSRRRREPPVDRRAELR
jgi:hypothetical protein